MNRVTFVCACVCAMLVAKTAQSATASSKSNVSLRYVVCGSASTFLSEKGACYVYEIDTKESYIEIKIATGINASAGTLLLGAQGKAMLEATVKLPLGTPSDEIVETAAKMIGEELAQEPSRRKLAKHGLKYDDVEFDAWEQVCKPEDEETRLLKKALGIKD